MSEVKVNKISPRSGTTITLGDSGDTFTVPSGVTFDASSGGLAGTLTTASQPNITSVGTLTSFTSTGIDDNATSTAITIDSSERVGIGTSSPVNTLDIHGDTAQLSLRDTSAFSAGTGPSIVFTGKDNNEANKTFGIISGLSISTDNGLLSFKTRNSGTLTERMRIINDGQIQIGKSTTSIAVVGQVLGGASNASSFTSTGTACYFNREDTDGNIILFRQDNNTEGSISVSGSTVSYNGFTGTHWSRFTDNSKPTILKGTVLESLDEMCDWYNLEFDVTTQDAEGNDVTTTEKVPHVLTDTQSNGDTVTYNHQGTDYQATIVKEADIKHMKSKVSDTTDAKNVYGVFVAYDEDGEGYNDFYVASVGSFVVRIKANETIAKGDLLQSNGDGTAKVQTDDNVKSSSFAKVLSTTVIETYDDGSYLVPCSLMC